MNVLDAAFIEHQGFESKRILGDNSFAVFSELWHK